jgi:hypothetical protein|tara:strand:+ start:810 stop:1010 length:201 start_codon:yes stop_codon:yes gene_type:complete
MLSKLFYKFKIGRTITALNSLDDATLKDIGLHRSNIRSHVYEIFEKEKPIDDPISELHDLYVKSTY